jgi:hypothetical protein
MRNLTMFKQLIGDDFHKNVTLATTCWSLVPFNDGVMRENELKTNSNFWRLMISNGAQLERISDDVTEARDLVYKIASHSPIALQTQRDVVELGISFRNLAVAKTVNYELEKQRREQRAERVLQAQKLARQERKLQEQVAELQKQNQRIQDAMDRGRRCSRKKPYGTCDNQYCSNRLQRYTVTWRTFFLLLSRPSTRLTMTIQTAVLAAQTEIIIGIVGLVAMTVETTSIQVCPESIIVLTTARLCSAGYSVALVLDTEIHARNCWMYQMCAIKMV